VPPKDDPAEPSTDDKDTSPMPFARIGSFLSPSAPGGNSSMLCGSSEKPSVATTAASEVSQSVPPKDDPAEPTTDDKDINPQPSARSGSPSPSAPGGDSTMFNGSPAKPSIATTAAPEVSQSVPPKDDPTEPPTDDKDTNPNPPPAAAALHRTQRPWRLIHYVWIVSKTFFCYDRSF
jgi:hypothetical protein